MRWQDLLAKLTGKPASPPEPQAGGGAGGPAPDEPAKPPADETTPPPPPTPAEPEPESVEPMQSSNHANSEPSPRQALSSYHVEDDVKSTARGPGHVKVDAVSRVYARALLEMAESQGKIDEIADEVDQLDELMRAQPELRQMLETPAISTDQRRDLIDRLFKGRVSDTTWRFLQVVNRKHRAAAVPGILAAFQQLLAEKRGIVEVNITVAQKLDPAEAEQVGQRIGEAIGKRVVLHQFVDENLIGGMVVRIGDQVIDGSVAAQLRNMRKQLIDRGRDRAREQTND